MKCGACGNYNAEYFHWAGVTSVRCPDCGSDLMPGVDLMAQEESRYYEQEYDAEAVLAGKEAADD